MLVPEETSLGNFRPGHLDRDASLGEEKHPGEGIEAVEPPPLYKLSAPAHERDQRADTPYVGEERTVDLGYGTPEGFEVYTTPNLQTPFGSTPVAVRATPTGPSMEELPPTATEAYVQGKAGEPLYYAVSTVEEEEPLQARNAARRSRHPVGARIRALRGGGKPGKARSRAPSAQPPAAKKATNGIRAPAKAASRSAVGPVKLETPAKKVVSCKAAAGKGHVVSSGLTGVSLAFTGCEKEHSACTSSGATAGEVRTTALSGLLAWEKKGKKAALDLSASPHASFAGFTCASQAEELQGSVIVPTKSSKASTATALKFKESKGIQKPSEYETAEGAKVKDSLVIGGVSEAIGLSGTITLTNEEALEVNPDI